MALQGNLKTMAVSDVLQFLAVGRKTGLLRVSHGRVVKGIYFENGTIIGSSTNDPKEYLGQVLIHYGKIDESQLQAAMEVQRAAVTVVPGAEAKNQGTAAKKFDGKQGGRLGQVLVAQGILTEAEVREVLQIRTLDIIYDLFIWKDGQFEFVGDDPLPPDFTRVNVDVTRVIMDGIHRADELARYRTLIPSDRSILELGTGWTSSLDTGKATRQLFFFLEKRMSVAEICYNMHSSSFEIYGQLYDLVKSGLVHVAGELPEIPDPVAAIPNLPEETPDQLLLARGELDNDQAEKALSIIHAVLRREPKNSAAQNLLVEAEKRFVEQIYSQISPTGVPKIVLNIEELAKKEMSPQEGFMLSRVNGEWDLQSVLSICPFREADSLLMIKKLWDEGIIGF